MSFNDFFNGDSSKIGATINTHIQEKVDQFKMKSEVYMNADFFIDSAIDTFTSNKRNTLGYVLTRKRLRFTAFSSTLIIFSIYQIYTH